MALANVTYTGDGTVVNYPITFDYLDRTHIAVFVDGVDTTDVASLYEFELTDDTHVDVTLIAGGGAVPPGSLIKIARVTPTNTTATVFADGAVVRASALNANTNQLLYISQEVKDNDASRMGIDNDDKFDALSKVIKNVADPVNAQDAATKGYLENTWLTPSDKAQLNSLNLTNLNTVATDVANVNTTATNIADVNTVATNIADVNTLAGISANVTSAVNNATNINAVVADAVDIGVVATNITDVNTVAGISANVTTAVGISADITAVAGDATDIGTVSSNITNVNTVAGISADVTTVAADGTDIGVVAGISADVTTVSGIAANVTSVAGNTTNINTVAADATDIGTVATNITNVNTAAGISANITTVAGIAADVTAAATNASDISAIAAEVAKVVTVANDLNEATSEIDVVANNIANVNLVGADISNVNIAATSLTNIADFNDIFVAGATAPVSPDNGDLWYDTVNSQLKVYVNSSFQVAGAYLQGLTSTHVFTATAAQTTFTTDDASNTMSIYANGNTLVFLNGIRLVEGSSGVNDYYIDGSSVELNSGAAASDVLYVEVFTKVSTTQEASLNQLVTDAQTAETNASTSETNAAASAASASADATSTAADVVTTNADVVITNADVVLTNADVVSSAASASAASTSETNAAASATQAAASAGGGTLKITSNDTTADVLGNKLVAGTGITATTNNAGSNETLTLSVNPFSLTETNATATAAQTAFTVSYTVGLIQVFMNGIKLSGSDFTATNGTSVTLASGAAAGDLLEFVVFG